MEDNKNILTDEQVNKISDKLENEYNEEVDVREVSDEPETEAEEIEKTEKEESDKMEYGGAEHLRSLGLSEDIVNEYKDIKIDNDHALDLNNVVLPDEDIRNTLAMYDVSDDDMSKMISIINKYRNDKSYNAYDDLPDSVKKYVIALIIPGVVNKEGATRTLLDTFVNDTAFGKFLDEYQAELNDVIADSNNKFQTLIKDSIDELYSKIDEIRKTNPEQADKIDSIRKALEDSKTYKRQLEYVSKLSAKKLNKFYNRYENECAYFNKRINSNTFDIKVPDIRRVYNVIKRRFNGFTEAQIKKFIIIISKSVYDIDVTNIADVSYTYKLVANILDFEYDTEFKSDSAEEIFNNIKEVIQKIIAL